VGVRIGNLYSALGNKYLLGDLEQKKRMKVADWMIKRGQGVFWE
jgi:hypothetical protein